jgi:hypothetical protein
MPRTAPTLSLLAAAALGCAARPRCGVAPEGAVVRWSDVTPDPATRFAVLPAVAQSSARFDAGAAAVLLRFGPEALGEAPAVERAALVLVPARGSRRERCAVLRVRAVDEPWSRAAVARGDRPALTGDGAAEVTLPPQRVPVRVDVTAMVRALGPEGLRRRGLAVSATEAGVAFEGSGTLSPEEGPRLEVLLR